MIYMLDANIISYIIKEYDTDLLQKFRDISKKHSIIVSVIVEAELLYGIRKRRSKRLEQEVKNLLSPFEIMPLDSKVSNEYAQIRASLEQKGTPIGANDLFIAAHALSLGATLVTNNSKEFERVDGLRVENWVR